MCLFSRAKIFIVLNYIFFMCALEAVSVKLYLIHFRMAFICFCKGTLHLYNISQYMRYQNYLAT